MRLPVCFTWFDVLVMYLIKNVLYLVMSIPFCFSWFDVLVMYPRSQKIKHKRPPTCPVKTPLPQQVI